ncbi:hypothetical protein CVD25_13280 [Bacillus canaveralius]|uniref:Uncharacterized protein n=1 Tax=Bacillus canaveralius TaxID=1403243 RepID=A0A2N5GGM9_9BACI|nr:hypothetical protein CU635_20660 [Bacillus canaveralius]PLR80435.1 hypothetical protein CVD23_21130 [Bacillus sp. V33-4]PLR96020.1 hypothetical protein CVD25_13280 [Bacillus canaveralius]
MGNILHLRKHGRQLLCFDLILSIIDQYAPVLTIIMRNVTEAIRKKRWIILRAWRNMIAARLGKICKAQGLRARTLKIPLLLGTIL